MEKEVEWKGLTGLFLGKDRKKLVGKLTSEYSKEVLDVLMQAIERGQEVPVLISAVSPEYKKENGPTHRIVVGLPKEQDFEAQASRDLADDDIPF